MRVGKKNQDEKKKVKRREEIREAISKIHFSTNQKKREKNTIPFCIFIACNNDNDVQKKKIHLNVDIKKETERKTYR